MKRANHVTRTDTEIETLKRYACRKIGELARHNEWLKSVEEQLGKMVVAKDNELKILSDEEANNLIKFSQEDAADEVFAPHEVQILKDIAREVVNLAVKDVNKNNILQKVADILHPLYSQDSRTQQIGWDLAEYMGWYFAAQSKAERAKYADELLSDWAF